MTDYATANGRLHSGVIKPNVARLQRLALWLIGFSGGFVMIEPSPYEIAVIGGLVLFFVTGMRMRAATIPLMAILFVLNLGYTICAATLLNEKPILMWVMTSWYMGVSTIFFAVILSDNTAVRIDALKRGLVIGAVATSILGIAGYFGLPGAAFDLFTLYGRAAGAFKDPNVYGAYLVLPAVFVLQNIVTVGSGKLIRNILALGVISLAIFLAFSRGAWGLLVFSSAFMLMLMLLTAPTAKQRRRIIGLTALAVVLSIVLIALILSLDSVNSMFAERATLKQGYDSGRFGRFGRHLLGAQMALDRPLGIGPLQFNKFFPEDVHNSYLNAFMSGGWISGICFPALVFVTIIQGFRILMTPTPWRPAYLAVYAVFLGTIGEAFIIDVDHWRHFWLMLGAVWGMIIATHHYVQTIPAAHPDR